MMKRRLFCLVLMGMLLVTSMAAGERAYLIADSDTRALTRAELWEWNLEAVNFIYNEILARHGYVFKAGGKFDNYFRAKGWYVPNANTNNQQACYPQVSRLEWNNISLCKEVINDMRAVGTTNPTGRSIKVGIPTVSNVLAGFDYCSLKAGQTLPVYSAPSVNSWRGSNGKAAVSTNGDVWSAGWENGWMLIMYGTNKGAVRVGYVQNLKGQVSEYRHLEFEYNPVDVLTRCTLTDDPAKQYASIMTLQPGDTVTLLTCFYNADAWAYVETTLNGQTVRGFVPMDCLEIDEDASPEIEAVG